MLGNQFIILQTGKEKSSFILSFQLELYLRVTKQIVDEGKFLFREVFQLLCGQGKAMIEVGHHHFITINEINRSRQWLLMAANLCNRKTIRCYVPPDGST